MATTTKSKAPRVPGGAEPTTTKSSTEEATNEAQASGELPDADSIDPKTLTRAVLTKQGWICPA